VKEVAPKIEAIIGLKSLKIINVHERDLGSTVEVDASFHGKRSCSACGSKRVHSRGLRMRHLKHACIGSRLVHLKVHVPKLLCQACGHQGMQRLPGILPRRRSTETFRLDVFHAHVGGISQKQLSTTHRIGAATVERWFKDFVLYKVKEHCKRQCPQVLGIDEHFFSRKKGFATTLVDLKNHHVFDLFLGRSEKALAQALEKLQGRNHVRIIVMDLSETYRAIAQKYFPNAMIVADRFHAVRLVQHHFQKLWGQLDPNGRKNRGLLSLFRRRRDKLSNDQKDKLNSYLEQIPGLAAIDHMQQKLLTLLRQKMLSRKSAKQLIPDLLNVISELKNSAFHSMQTLGNTLERWIEALARMWRFTKSNGITEGFHNKMEMISRRAFGFRNFQNYRMRVIALCGWNGIFNRV
jgi:transposase